MAAVCNLLHCTVKMKTGRFSILGLPLRADSRSVWSAVFSTAFRALSNNARKDLNLQPNGERNRERDKPGSRHEQPVSKLLNLYAYDNGRRS